MKIILISPPTPNLVLTNLPETIAMEETLPPLGIMYVAAYLQKYTNHEIKIIDCLVEKMDFEQLEERLKEEKPDVVGMTALTFTIIDVLNTARLAKKINPNTKVILGGPHANIYPKETINFQEIDFLVMGEGEEPSRDLIENINDIDKLKQIKGLVFKDNGQIIDTGHRDLLPNLDELPFPARELAPYEKYSSMLSDERPATTMFSSRGCPFRCLFCNRAHLGKQFRARSASNVVDEMEVCQKLGIKEIFMYDDTFTVNRQRVLDICSEIEKRGLKINWDVRARVDTIDEEILQKMKKAGCQRIHYGVEAGTEKILKVIRKGITLEQVEKAFRLTRKAKIQSLAYFMIGHPRETVEDIKKTIKFAKKINPDFVCFSITTPYPQTDLYIMGMEEGIIKTDCWREFAKNPTPDFVSPLWEADLTREELFRWFKKAYRAFYLRPSYVAKKVLQVRSGKEFMRKAKAALNITKI
jgi:radical SAM superfamily enzyme YgiQ (UPF0313 family)